MGRGKGGEGKSRIGERMSLSIYSQRAPGRVLRRESERSIGIYAWESERARQGVRRVAEWA